VFLFWIGHFLVKLSSRPVTIEPYARQFTFVSIYLV
jgi:hypothetical protein